ncbi:centrosomal protein of 57 kDa isoform 2-T2 [Mantella aurantiaca]
MSRATLQPRMLDSPLPGSWKGAQSGTSYTSYPHGKPFINSHFPGSPDRPGHAYPESNGKAIISALKNLQEKLRRLELDRQKAEENIKQLAKESSDYRQQLDDQRQSKDDVVEDVSRRNKDLTRQLLAAQSRCSLLERQLEYMKKTVRNAESERNSVLQKQVSLESDQALEKINLGEKLDKLEQEYMKLTTIQVVSENKIRDIEQKLREEEHQRKRIEDKAAQLQSNLETNRILFKSLTSLTKDTKSTKAASYTEKAASSVSHSRHTQPHYRLSLGDVPFVAGKSTAPSHSVAANVQHVIHLMKQHKKVLCNERVVSDQPIDGKRYGVRWKNDTDSKAYQDLSDLLLTLEDEFGQMSFDHQELLKQIHKAHSDRLKMDLEFELATLVKRMEAKADQITKLAKLLRESRPRKEPSTQGPKSPQRGKDRPSSKTRQGRGSPGEKSKKNLQLLRDMQTLQSSLQRDDIHWS